MWHAAVRSEATGHLNLFTYTRPCTDSAYMGLFDAAATRIKISFAFLIVQITCLSSRRELSTDGR